MKLTKMRHKDDSKLDNTLSIVTAKLQHKLTQAGFITEVSIVNSSSIKIGMHMCSFRIDVNKLGYNARVNDYTIRHTKTGYKRTSTPTWTQREEFNHIVNNVLDSLKIKANIKSGEFIIRDYTSGRVNQWDMPEPFHNGYRLNVASTLEIVPMKYASCATEWVGINAPFIGAVPETTPRFMPKGK